MKTMQAATADARKNCHPKVIASVIVYQTEAGRWHWCTAESPVGVSLQTTGLYNRNTNERAQKWEQVQLWS